MRTDQAKKLEQWFTTREGPDPYRAPECNLCLVGHCNGEKIVTSPVVKTRGRFVQTLSGSVYELGTPEKGFLAHLKSIGHPFDPKHPIRVLRP
jgi:hypothetical protein